MTALNDTAPQTGAPNTDVLCYAYASLAPMGGVWVEASETGALAIYGTIVEARAASDAKSPIVPVIVRRITEDEMREAKRAHREGPTTPDAGGPA